MRPAWSTSSASPTTAAIAPSGLSDWATLLRLPSASDLPLHYDWIPAYRALTQILRWLRQPELNEPSPYLLASQARTLLDDIAQDLSYAGIPAGLHSAHGANAFEQLTSITRTAIANVRHNR